jgi:hypothetical protein
VLGLGDAFQLGAQVGRQAQQEARRGWQWSQW